MGCGIYTKYFIDDININTTNIDTDALLELSSFEEYQDNISGLWKPIIITRSESSAEYCEPLVQVKTDFTKTFDICNCSSQQLTDVNNNFYAEYNEVDLDWSYCCTSPSSVVTDSNGQDTVLSCDVQFHSDDFLPKIPVLNQSYISGFYDFKHLKQFPACNNPGLGIERFVTYDDFCIDWKLKETISEIPYDSTNSYHINEYTHNKSYEKSQLLSSTCGNFILISVDPMFDSYTTEYSDLFGSLDSPEIIPPVEKFTKPYGFSNNNHNNIFINREKIASYWKWNYTSGVLGWYRYFDINRENDTRPIAGVDLYISPGDVFFAQNDGPEPPSVFDFDTTASPDSPSPACPSGLKIVDGATFKGIVPPSSNFVYISTNLYERFYSLYEKYIELGFNHSRSFNLSAIMCTSPLYDGITTDLLDNEGRKLYSEFNEFEQIDLLNKNMLKGTKYDSANNLNYISNKEELIRTLYAKYGGYEWIPPNSTLTKNLTINNRSNSLYIDLDFDMVIDLQDTKFRNINSRPYRSCEQNPLENINRKFFYDQSIIFGNLNIGTSVDSDLRYSNNCDEEKKYSIYGNILYNDVVLKSRPIFSGVTSFSNKYTTLNFNRSYKAIAFNPHLDLLATHPNGGIYFNASTFGENEDIAFNANINAVRSNSLDITFNTKDVGIKLYRTYVAKLQSDTPGTESCLRFPVNEDKCRCYGLNIEHYNAHPIKCSDSRTTTLDSSPFFLPGLSTRYSPRLRRYGGYSTQEAIDLFGPNSLYDNDSASTFLPTVERKLDPEYPYECEQSATISLTNYSTTDYYVTLNNFSNRYSDIYITINESADLLGQPWLYVATENENDIWIENTSWKRFLNKVESNNVVVYDQQEKILFLKDQIIPKPLKITITNPFINALLDNSNEKLSVPSTSSEDSDLLPIADPCDQYSQYTPVETQSRIGRNRGDEISSVSITIKQKPRKQLLAYRIKNFGTTTSTARKGAYHPNFGLIEKKDMQTSFSAKNTIDENGRIFYNSGLRDIEGAGEKTIIIELNGTVANTLQQISDFELHRKPRALITTSNSSSGPAPYSWQPMYNNRGGYRLNNIDYIGNPKFFNYNNTSISYQPDPYMVYDDTYLRYINLVNKIRNPPLLVPAPPKTNIFLDYVLHTQPGLDSCDENNLSVGGLDMFPAGFANLWKKVQNKWLDQYRFWNPIFTSNPRVVRFYGSRPYFRIPEKRTIIDYSDTESLEDFIQEESASSELISNTILQLKNGYFFYTGPQLNDTKNYIFIGNDISILTNYSNLNIDFKNFSSTGYVYNTQIDCDTSVELYKISSLSDGFIKTLDSNGNPLLRITGSNVIVSKRIVVELVNKQGQPISANTNENVYVKIFTEFTFRDKILNNSFNLIWPNPNRSSIVIYDGRMISTDKDVLLSNKFYTTKWGDLIKYDNNLFNNPHLVDYTQLPKSIYNNLFFKQIVNDNLETFEFLLDINRSDSNEINRENCLPDNINLPLKLSYDANNRPYFCIYQKYDLDHNQIWSIDLDQYQNYIPMMEINFSDKIPDIMTSGTVKSSALCNNIKNPLDFPDYYIIPLLGTSDDFLHNVISDEAESTRRSQRLAELNEREWSSSFPYLGDVNLYFMKVPELFKSFVGFSNSRADWIESLKVQCPRYALLQTILENNESDREDVREIFRPDTLNTINNTQLINNNINTEGFRLGTLDRDTPFISRTIYADIDEPEDNTKTCGSKKCQLTTAGNISLKSRYRTFLSRYVSYDGLGDDIQDVSLSYDGGSLNVVGLNNTSKQIVRTMLDPGNPIVVNNTCQTSTPKPSMPFYRLINDIDAQNYLNDKYEQRSQPVSRELAILDDNANEILFRLLNDEKQKINRKQLFKHTNILTKNELINFVEPEITAKEIYNHILYNYDTVIKPGANINGNLTINGTKNIGDLINITLYNINISLGIFSRQGGNVSVIGNVGDNPVDEILHRRTQNQISLITVEYSRTTSSYPPRVEDTPSESLEPEEDEEIPSDPLPADDTESIELLTTRTTSDVIVGSVTDVTLKPGACDPWAQYEEGGGEPCLGGGTMTNIWAAIGPKIEYPPPACGKSKWYDPFKYGYCRHIDTELLEEDPQFVPKCVNCTSYGSDLVDNYLGIEGGPEFDYEFEKCSTTFKLKGHLYRLKFGEYDDKPTASCEVSPDIQRVQGWSADCTDILGDDIGCWGNGRAFIPTRDSEGNPCTSQTGSCQPRFLCLPTWGNPWQCNTILGTTTTTTTRKVFKKTKTVDLGPYISPNCTSPFINISYTKNRVTVSIPDIGKTYCIDVSSSSDNCPSININMPQGYVVNENITGECVGACGDSPEINLEEEDNNFNFSYNDYLVVCELGRITYGDLQGDTVVTNGFRPHDGLDDFGRPLPPCYGHNGWIMSLCGGGALWRNCGGVSERGLTYGGVAAGALAEGWKTRMRNIYDNSAIEPCKIIPAIPSGSIIEGIMPGTCSFNIKDISIEQPKSKGVSRDLAVSSTWTVTTSIAYISYTYRKAKTIQDHLLSKVQGGNINNDIVVEDGNFLPSALKTANGINPCKKLGFPPRFNGSGGSYKLVPPIYRRTSCDSSPVCYYDEEIDNKQTPCNYTDWICWSYTDNISRTSFLNRIFKDPTGITVWVT